MTRTVVLPLLLAVALTGCSSPPGRSLNDINGTRVYAAELQQVFDAVRYYCVKEAFIMDRFEQESGSVIAHKVFGGSGIRPDHFAPADRLVVMRLRVREIAPGRTETSTTFTFGNGQVVTSRDDEGILVDNYTGLFGTLDDRLGAPRQANQ